MYRRNKPHRERQLSTGQRSRSHAVKHQLHNSMDLPGKGRGKMTSNEEYREFIHKLTEKIGDNARLKKLYTVANRLCVHEPVEESNRKANR